jgi:Concanavalin A-like lectin/glucanases superfamily
MRHRVALLVLALGGCTPDTSGLGGSPGDEAGSTAASHGSSDTSTGSDPTLATGSGSETSSGASVDGGSTTGSTGSTDEGTSTEGTTGEPSVKWCTPEPALAACYDFAGVGRGMLWDSSGNDNHAAAVGVGVVPGPLGEAATFDDGSEIAVPDSASLDIPDLLTLEAWVRVDGLPRSGRMGIIDNEGQYSLMIYASDEYRCDIDGAGLYAGPVVQGEWSHVACVFDGAAMRAYVNGTQIGMLAATGPLLTANGYPMSIGDTSPELDEPLRGAVGGVRVWSRALEPAELCEAAGDACSN